MEQALWWCKLWVGTQQKHKTISPKGETELTLIVESLWLCNLWKNGTPKPIKWKWRKKKAVKEKVWQQNERKIGYEIISWA